MTTAVLAVKRSWETAPFPRRWGALLIGALALAAAVVWARSLPASSPLFALGLGASLLTGLATGAGALPVLWINRVSAKAQDAMLGFGAGVMLAAASFSLILPGIEAAQVYTGGKAAAVAVVAAGLALGGLFLFLADRLTPHEHFIKGPEGAARISVRRTWLLVFAMALHNFPEGLAVGLGFSAGDRAHGAALALGIGMQNLPEGLVVAAALLTLGYGKGRALALALATGLVEPLGGVLGAGLVSAAQPLLPWGLAFAAGAMLFVVSHEIIPESHRQGHETHATLGVLAGFVVMMVLDTALG